MLSWHFSSVVFGSICTLEQNVTCLGGRTRGTWGGGTCTALGSVQHACPSGSALSGWVEMRIRSAQSLVMSTLYRVSCKLHCQLARLKKKKKTHIQVCLKLKQAGSAAGSRFELSDARQLKHHSVTQHVWSCLINLLLYVNILCVFSPHIHIYGGG